jgi:uncharacterized protein (TIGR02453 family)
MLTNASLQFLDDLKANNNREWFLENKKRYENYKKEYHQLISDLLDVIKPLDASLEMLEVKNCTFRINRDIRFSKDKSPYKTHLGIWMSSGSKIHNRSGYYIHIDRNGCFLAGGLYVPEAADLKKIRHEIAYFYEDLEAILNDKNFKKEYGTFDDSENFKLKNPPKGFDKEHPAIEYLKLKSFTTTQGFDIQEVLQKDFVSKISKKLIVLKPLNDFLNRAVTSD